MKSQPEAIVRRLRDQGGFTLAGAMVGLTIILIISVGSMGVFSKALRSGGETKHLTAATNIAKSYMEEIKATDFNNITALFPDGTANAITDGLLPSGATCTVTYPDGISSEPLTVVVTVSWPEGDETQSIQLITAVMES